MSDSELLPNGSVLLGKFHVVDVLGRGGFGVTYDGFDDRLQRRVAIKELFPDGSTRRGSEVIGSNTGGVDIGHLRQRFIEEARALARFDFPGIVRVLEAFEDNGTAYMVMEYLEGESLEQRCDRLGRLTSAETSQIISQLCDALEQVHAAGMLHRDVKPSNVILHPVRGAVLIDFGSARPAVAGTSKMHTQLVSHGYAAPEQYASSNRLSPATDIYALGATAWHVVTGEPPISTLDRVSGMTLPSVYDEAPKITPQLGAFIDAALVMDVVRRPATIAEARTFLRARSESEGDTTWPARPQPGPMKTVAIDSNTTGTEVPRPPKAGRKNRKLLGVAIGLAALVVGGAGLIGARNGAQDLGSDTAPDSEPTTESVAKPPDSVIPPENPPAMPTGLTVGYPTATTLLVSWNEPEDLATFDRYEVSMNGGPVDPTPNPQKSFIGLKPDTSHSFRVRVCSRLSCSPYTPPAVGTTASVQQPIETKPAIQPATETLLSDAVSPLPTPTGLAVGSPTATSLDVSWDQEELATFNRYEVSMNGGPGDFAVFERKSFDGLNPNTSYSFRVRACSKLSCSPYTDPVLGTTLQG
jgi:serine/threonine protein kinase